MLYKWWLKFSLDNLLKQNIHLCLLIYVLGRGIDIDVELSLRAVMLTRVFFFF